jgi:DUF2075 family protein
MIVRKTKNVDTLQLLRNVYRILLLRGHQRNTITMPDDETREHFPSELKLGTKQFL